MKKTKKKISLSQLLRLLLQIVCFFFLPTLYIETLNGIKGIYQAILHQNFNTDLIPQLIEVIAIIPVTLVLGRFFCGWMCAFGSFSDFIYQAFHKVFHKKIRVNVHLDAWLKVLKYVVLIKIVVDIWTLGLTSYSSASPWDAFGMLFTIGKLPDLSYVAANLTTGLILLVLISAASALIERFFCRYLCPMGAIFALISRGRIAKIKKPTAECGNCRACTSTCSMGIPLYKMESVSSGECIQCMKCVSVCPRGNAKLTVAKNDVRPFLAGAATVAAISGIYFTGNFTVAAAENGTTTAVAESGQSQNATRQYRDGTYEGSGSGYRGGTTTVSVTIQNGNITDIKTVSHGDDAPFYNRAYSSVTQEIVSRQSASVDAVSGATYSSNGIMQAVANALEKAKTVEISEDSGSSGDTAENTVPSQSSGSQSSEIAESPAADNSGKYKDGTYQGTGIGFRGATTTVSVTVSGGQITDVALESSGDDRKFIQRAYSVVSQEIIRSQSANVDAVSGATYSSNGIMQAVANALSSAEK